MDFLPLLTMMNSFGKKGANASSNPMEGMFENMNKLKQMENMGADGGMEMMMNIMGQNNPDMKNAMQMAQMMSKMSSQSPQQNTQNNTSQKETDGEEKFEQREKMHQSTQNDSEEKFETNPLKPITKIANKDITYILNRYINE